MAATSRAAMRGSHLKSNVEALAHLGRSNEQAIRAQAAAAVQLIEDASRVAWLPLQLDVELTEAVDAVVGRTGLRRWCGDAIRRSTEGPLLRPVLAGIATLGLSPHNLLRRVPYGWTLIYRDCGELTYTSLGESAAELVQSDACPEMLGCQAYVDGIAGVLEAVVQLAGTRPVTATATIDAASTRVVYRCEWR